MKLVFLPSSQKGLTWFRQYYSHVFPEGANNAKSHYNLAVKTLSAFPLSGKIIEGKSSRILPIPRTPFSFIYRVKEDRIEVLAIFDERSDPSQL